MKTGNYPEVFARAQRQWPAWVTLLATVVAATTADLLRLTRYSIAVGVDGYYYVAQINHLRDSGALLYPTSTPLTLYFLYAVRLLVGDSVLAVKVGSVILHALLCLGIYAVVKCLTGSRWLGIMGLCLAAFPGLHLYLVVEYINSLGALALLTWALWAGLCARRAHNRAWGACSAGLLVAALLSHRLILPLLALIAVAALLAYCLIIKKPVRRRNRLALWAAFVCLFCAPALLLTFSFVELPPWLRSELLNVPRWPFRRFDVAEGLMLLLAAPTALALAVRAEDSGRVNDARLAVTTVAMLGLLIPLNPFLNHDTGFQGVVGRLSSLIYIQAAILVPGLFCLAVPAHRVAKFIALAAAVLMALSMTEPLPHGLTSSYMTRRERLIQQLSDRPLRFCDAPVIIATHGEQFVVTATLGLPAQQRPPREHASCAYWLLHGVRRSLLQSEQNVLGDDGGEFVSALVEDVELVSILGKLTDGERRQLLSANPHLREALRTKALAQSYFKPGRNG